MSARLGLALYTVRDACARDFEGTLRSVAEIGYEGVEPNDLFGRDARALRALLDDLGLVVTSRHAGLEAIETSLDGLADELGELGSDRLVLSWIAQPASGAEADRVVDRIGAAAERAKAAGLRLGFHNHDGELRPLEDGRTVIDRLLQLDDDLLFLQLDLGWAWFAGVEPVGLVEQVSPRAPLVHVKDLGAGTRPRFVAVGDGAVDYPRVLPAIRDFDVEWLLIEQDETEGDTLEAARRSFAAVTTMVASPT